MALENIELQLNKLMEVQYAKLNKKLDTLTNSTTNQYTPNNTNTQNHNKIVNLTNINFTQEQLQLLAYGPNFAIEQSPKKFINQLIIDTENAVRNLDPKLQGTYRHLAAKQIKYIMNNSKENTVHKRNQYTINKIRNLLQQHNLTLVKADKSKAMVIIDRISLEGKNKLFYARKQNSKIKQGPN